MSTHEKIKTVFTSGDGSSKIVVIAGGLARQEALGCTKDQVHRRGE